VSDVKAATSKKHVWAFVEDTCASAAYWVASQASRIVANNSTAGIGSIGTFMALYDVSGAAAMQGIKAVVIRSGKLKGAGFPGTEVTEEQKAVWQDLVDKTQQQFTAGVAAGRNIDVNEVESLAEGRMWLAEDAKQLRLIDEISSFETVISNLAATARRKGRNRMSETNTPKAATWQELKACCPGADSEFLGKQMDANATTDQASGAWMTELQLRAEIAEEEKAKAEAAKVEAEQQAAEAKADAEKAKAGKPGVDMLGGGGNSGDGVADPVAAFHDAVEEKMKAGMSKPDAVRSVIKSNPDLHASYIEAHNAEVGPSSFRKN